MLEELRKVMILRVGKVNPFMKRFVVEKTRKRFLNLEKALERIKMAGNYLSRFNSLVIGNEKIKPQLEKFSNLTKIPSFYQKPKPGILTNPSLKEFLEKEVLFIFDKKFSLEIVQEALRSRIPLIGVCEVSEDPRFLDLIIPWNKKDKNSVAALFWALTYFTLEAKQELKRFEEFKCSIKDFLS